MLLGLPQEILQKILFHLDPIHLIRIVLTCRSIAKLIEVDIFWKFLCQKLLMAAIQPIGHHSTHFLSYKDCFVKNTDTRLTIMDDFQILQRPMDEINQDTFSLQPRFGAFLDIKATTIIFQGHFELFLIYRGNHDLDFNLNILVDGQIASSKLHSLHHIDESSTQKFKLGSFQVTSYFSTVTLEINEILKRGWVEWTWDQILFYRNK
ncbi:hypothetical protein HMI54_012112 [Coelomomyces lativittatus]|nr:hypothetical protein HMI54_012112 [Coelomomyces lativittatus]